MTLIELLLVIIVIGALSALIAPNVTSGLAAARVKGSLSRLTNLCFLAATTTLVEARPVHLRLNQGRGAFWLEIEKQPNKEPGVFEPIRQADAMAIQLDEDLKVVSWKIANRTSSTTANEEDDDEEDESTFVEFRPDGTSDRTEFHLETSTGDRYTLYIAGMTSRVALREGWPEEKDR